MLVRSLNSAWMLLCSREAHRFRDAMNDIVRVQAVRLREILAANAGSQFGRDHGFGSTQSVRDFQSCVPLSTYEDYESAIQRIGNGEANVLTTEPVQLLEPTSGTSGAQKLIPYTASLRREFQRGVAAWMHDIYRSRPQLRGGRTYWSISPAMQTSRRTASGIPIGFDDDAAYLGTWGRRAQERLMIRPPGIAQVQELDSFRYCTLLWLLRAADLSLISIWSPTFLEALLENVDPWHERLVEDIRRGTVSPPGPLSPQIHERMRKASHPDASRARELHSIFSNSQTFAEKLEQVWKRLAFISCWSDGAAASHLASLQRHFPNVEFQAKGLLATEAFISLPLLGREGAALALRSHFLEFEEIPTNADGDNQQSVIRLAYELEVGRQYSVIVTTGGGLYRYQMRDAIEVVDFAGQCPLIRFVGKIDEISDMVGEKLSETHVRTSLADVFLRHRIAPSFSIVAPVTNGPRHYCLYLQLDRSFQPDAARLAADLQSALESNPHYRYATALGQLAPITLWICRDGEFNLRATYERARLEIFRRSSGPKLGGLKPLALEKRLDVARTLQTECFAESIENQAGIAMRNYA